MRRINEQELKEFYGGSVDGDEIERIPFSTVKPFTVLIEGSFMEFDQIEKWFSLNNLFENTDFNYYFFGKTGYDFGCYEIYNGMRKDDNIFNEQRPKDKKSATFSLNSYDQQFFKTDKQTDKIKEFLSKVRLNRNVQNITQIKLEGYNVASARADYWQLLKLVHHKTEIRYETLSTQNNRMDISMGIQENKHQNQNKIPKTIERLICFLKNRNLEKIKAHFREVTDTYDNLQRQRQKEINDQKIAALLQQQLLRQQEEEEEEDEEDEDEDEEDADKDDEDKDDEATELDQLSLFDKSAKQLAIICEYYGLLKSKLKKQEMIEKILQFENDSLNKKVMTTRYKIWNVMDKLKQDKIMKKYIIWI